MNVNDLIVQEPSRLFLDYLGLSKSNPPTPRRSSRASRGLQIAGCPDRRRVRSARHLQAGRLRRRGPGGRAARATDPTRMEPGDVVLELASSGVHSNGYTLVQKIIERAGLRLDETYPDLESDRTLGDLLLEPTRSTRSRSSPCSVATR